ncbi:caspase family protein [Kamptonema formosum]|uniref:caspase family protein n=1 Tax=Kamptonema formosum TaxID=331992 RepID=UPI0012DD3243|nr:caspase family protein [Oscillatoria sp. PCC 10802]
MKNYAGIVIGINKYQFFHALSYAKQDAQALENFLIESAGFAPDRCVLLTDTSPPADSHSTYPNRQNLLRMIDEQCRHQLRSGDVLWLFFCGVAVSADGEDYLMPADGNPADIASTGISARWLFSALKSCRTQQVLVLLDMYAATGSEQQIGSRIAKLAREMEIPVLLSCQNSDFSSETDALQHGFFTAALLEGLRSGKCKTFEGLAEFLSDRLPQLWEEYKSPRQDLLITFNPPEKLSYTLLPDIDSPTPEQWLLPAVPLRPEEWELVPEQVGALREPVATGAVANALTGEPPAQPKPPVLSHNGKTPPETSAPQPQTPQTPVPASPTGSQSPPSQTPPPPGTPTRGVPVAPLALGLLGSAVVGLLVLFGFLVADLLKFGQQKLAHQPAPAPSEQVPAAVKPTPTAPPAPVKPAEPKPPTPVAVIPAPPAPAPAKPAAAKPPAPAKPAAAKPPAPAKPAAAKPPAPVAVIPAAPAKPPKNPQEANQQKLNKALVSLQPTQAYQFSDAIAQARQIPKNDPLYQEAQNNIDRWGRVIFDIAIARAKQENYKDAIAAGRLVPSEATEVHKRTQQLIDVWEKLYKDDITNKRLLADAQKLVRRGQASSYSKAIAKVRDIGPEDPHYQEARTLINQWGDSIWQIAQYRARVRMLPAAIAAAKLVPSDTPAGTAAQKALKQWQPPQRAR